MPGPHELVDRRCVNCRHAMEADFEDQLNFGVDEGTLFCDAEADGIGIVEDGYMANDARLVVIPSFGCVLWEAKS